MAKNESSTCVIVIVVVALIEKRTSTSHRELTRFLPDIVVIDK